jgi:hypothetical protein
MMSIGTLHYQSGNRHILYSCTSTDYFSLNHNRFAIGLVELEFWDTYLLTVYSGTLLNRLVALSGGNNYSLQIPVLAYDWNSGKCAGLNDR